MACMTMDTPIHPILPPPAIYDHAYKGRLTVQQGTMAQVEHYCHTTHGIVSPYQALGCSKVDEYRCFLIIPSVGGQVTASIQAPNSPTRCALQWLARQPPAISSGPRSCCGTKLANVTSGLIESDPMPGAVITAKLPWLTYACPTASNSEYRPMCAHRALR